MKALLLFAFLPVITFAQAPETEKGIHFEHSAFAELLAKAKKENKLVMVDAFTTWCGPCKWMAKNIFPNDTVGIYYNSNFVNAKIDMEKGEGVELAKKYGVTCYPTYLFINGNGELLHRISGSMGATEFVEVGKTAMNPAKQFSAYQRKYESGKISNDELGEYVLMRGRTCMGVKDEMAKYFSTQKDADLTSQRNWDIYNNNLSDIKEDSREFKYLTTHRAEFAKIYAAGKVDTLIINAYSSALYNHIKTKNYEGYDKLMGQVSANATPSLRENLAYMDLVLYKSKKEWGNFATAALFYIEKYKNNDANTLNNVAWDFYEHVEDHGMLVKAEDWIKHSVELQPGYFNYDTYASLLYKLGKKAEAKTTAEKAIELGRREGQDVKGTQELLDKINAL